MSDSHKHDCDHLCGAFYVCRLRDGCDYTDWTCPACDDDDYAAELTAIEEKERTHGDYCEGW